ncbi:phage tail domain-containing protein [Staphylococcus chromogenes]|uniref:phage tail domain-containing protein n=1 Tax=Staphylococcus chromogenes TaxID=46126 RepID=UPI003D7A18CB
MELEITKRDGTKYRLGDYGVIVKDIQVDGLESEENYSKIDSLHGRFLNGTTYSKRRISVPCFFEVDKLADFQMFRDLLFDLVTDTEPFYIRELRKKEKSNYKFLEPLATTFQKMDKFGRPDYNHTEFDSDYYVSGKQYLVKLHNTIQPKQTYKKANIELEFETTELPFAESIGTSLDLEKNDKLDIWSQDMNITFNEKSKERKYTFENIKSDSVYYHGNVPNDQFNMYNTVTIKLGQDTKDFSWTLQYSEIMTIRGLNLKAGDTIKYNGIDVTRNGITINEYTRLSQPKFKHGYNKFEFNQTVRKVVFDMKFYFK